MKAILAISLVLSACGSTTPTGMTRSEDPERPSDASVLEASVATKEAGIPDAVVPPPDETDAKMDAASPPAPGLDAPTTWVDECENPRPDAHADAVVSFTPGDNAGFGKGNMPCVVRGEPRGGGAGGGSTDVVSLGKGGTLVLAFEDVELVDEPGPDLTVFENAFTGFAEPGFVAVSADGETWSEWHCEPAGDYPHCAGVHAEGDSFDLAELGVSTARFVRVRDAGRGLYTGLSGGFDLDAITALHSRSR